MASEQSFVDFLLEHIDNAGEITAKLMFGDHALYSDGKIFGLIHNNKLYIKPTELGRKFIGDVVEVPTHPGSKPNFLIEDDKIKDKEWISKLVRITVQ